MEMKTFFEILTIGGIFFATKVFCYDIGKLCQKGFKGTGLSLRQVNDIGLIGCGRKCVRLGGCKGFSFRRDNITCILTDSTGCAANSDGWTFCGDLEWIKETMGPCSDETVPPGRECFELSSGQSKILYNHLWPQGPFTLLKPDSGCPLNFEAGSINISVEGGSNESVVNHAFGFVAGANVSFHFCTNTYASAQNWPAGDYCILTSEICPAGFLYSAIRVYTTALSMVSGTVGLYYNYLQCLDIYFCCRSDGDVNVPITLPTNDNFFLFRYLAASCQKVHGMTSIPEYTYFANTLHSHGSSDIGLLANGTLNYCYFYK